MMNTRAFTLVASLVWLLASNGAVHAQAAGSATARLHALFTEAWAFELREDPLLATETGLELYNSKLPSVTKDDEARRARMRRSYLGRLKAISRIRLGTRDRVSYDMFQRMLEDRVSEFEFGAYRIPILADAGFHIEFAQLASRVPLGTTRDYDNYIARLRAFPEYTRQNIGIMREGMDAGFTIPKVTMQGYDVTIATHMVDDLTKSVFYKPFEAFPTTVPERDQERLREEGKRAIAQGAIAGYRAFLAFMTSEYVPRARESLGASELPNGRAYYDYLVRSYTTLDVTPGQVHDIGLGEVRRIRAEMDGIIRETGFTGDFAAFLAFLRSDPRFYAKTGEELLKEASWIAKRMDGQLPRLFKTLPRLPYGVEAVPAHLAPKYTAGRYISAPRGSTRPGYYWVNTFALESRPLYALEALTLHEAVPGHHLQFALSRELEGLPEFRRFAGISAYSEGWGLYSERLGLEAGFYKDPYRNFGRLTYEMWRACRLVVDTGLHSMGWTRDQAMEFMAANTALSLHEVKTETDRYISWPGQALAYKMGEIKIRELRGKAEAQLGDRFDVREFHDVVLRNGVVPLTVLESEVNAWLASQGRSHRQ